MSELEQRLFRLADLKNDQLKVEWRRVYYSPPPISYTSDLLMRGIAHKVQEKAIGCISIEARKFLTSFGSDNVEQPLSSLSSKPGTCFVRSWQGRTWTVMATDRGFECEGETYRSLSAIARMITGTRWSGPRFFGLRESNV